MLHSYEVEVEVSYFRLSLSEGLADVEEEMLRWSRTWMWRWIWWRRGVEGGGGGTVDTMEGQDPTTVTLLHTNQSGALSLSMQ